MLGMGEKQVDHGVTIIINMAGMMDTPHDEKSGQMW